MSASAASPAAASSATSPVALQRALSLRDVVLLNVVGITSLRWLATSARTGPSALTLWVLAALMFFVPLGLAVSELSVRYPAQGGIYAWTKRSFGEGHGFLCGWCYWVNNLLYYPNLLMASAVMATYAIGRGGTGLEHNWGYVVSATLTMLWLATALNIVGLGTGKWLQNLGAICALAPGVLLLACAAYAMATRTSATPITAASLLPDFGKLSEVNLWASIAFAFTGIELSSTMADEIREPARTLPRAVLLTAPIVVAVYLLGTLAVLWLVPSGEVSIVAGFLQAIQVGVGGGSAFAWVVSLCALSYVIGNMGGVGAWLIGPARVAFVIGLDRYFPPAFGRIHPRWKTPWVAILVQSSIATVLLLLSVLGEGTTVERSYLVLLDTMILIYFIPFVYLFLTYLREAQRAPSRSARGVKAWLVGLSGLGLTVLSMVVACVPPSDTPSVAVFELKVVGGALFFVLLGGAFYWRARRA